jgi:hypothetical protein
MPSQRTGRFDAIGLERVSQELEKIKNRPTGSGLRGLVSQFFNNRERNEIVRLVRKLNRFPLPATIYKESLCQDYYANSPALRFRSTIPEQVYSEAEWIENKEGGFLEALRSMVKNVERWKGINRKELQNQLFEAD